MSTKHFVDETGNYIGGFGDGAVPPEGAIEVFTAPSCGTDTWNGEIWIIKPLSQKAQDKAAKLTGFGYNGTMGPVTSEDANGVMQMKIAFEEMEIASMSFEMTNGEALSITLEEWPAFKTAFFGCRSSFFNVSD